MTTQITPDVGTLRREIQEKYTEVSTSPERTFHFHHGRPLAHMLGYPMDRVDAMPAAAVESFAGVGNPFSLGIIPEGATVMDVGSGGGFDCFIAGQAVGSGGKVIGVDMTDAMLARGALLFAVVVCRLAAYPGRAFLARTFPWLATSVASGAVAVALFGIGSA